MCTNWFLGTTGIGPFLQGCHKQFHSHTGRKSADPAALFSTSGKINTNLWSVAHCRPAVPRGLGQGSCIIAHVHGKALFCLIRPLLIKFICLMFWQVVQALLL